MPYNIIQSNAQAFIDKNLKLPRYQRKQTWGPEDNFKLCVSIFKGYPIGVVIINYNNGEGFLLDGRQRKNALTLMKSDPVEVYAWAKKFLGLKDSDNESSVKQKFTDKINHYLQGINFEKSKEDANKETPTDEISNNDISSDFAIEEGIERSISIDTQSKNLEVLVKLILLVHGKFNGLNNLFGHFKFNNYIPFEKLEYVHTKNGEAMINGADLKLHIKYLIDSKNTTEDKFTEYVIRRYNLDDKTTQKVRDFIHIQWEYFENCFNIIANAEDIINSSQLGIIEIQNARAIDAQNIFSLINKEGTKLTSEELLSARPFWNKQIKEASDSALREARSLYNRMGITPPPSLVYWDVCATFIYRIDPNNFLFKKIDETKEKQFSTKITLGFKLFSGIINGGITGISVSELEKADRTGTLKFNWEKDVEPLIADFNTLINLLCDCEYFRYFLSWKQSISSILGDTRAMEYAILIYKNWYHHGKPLKNKPTELKKFYRDSIILIDKLIYEYLDKQWAGSSFGKVANDIKDSSFSTRFKVIPVEKWKELLDSLATEECDAPKGAKEAFLYHYYCIKKMMPITAIDKSYEMDHIFAQRQFETSTISIKWKDNLCNFALLPKKDNISKSDKTLLELQADKSNTWLFDEVKRYTEITDRDIAKFSDINNIQELINKRLALFKSAMSKDRLATINQ